MVASKYEWRDVVRRCLIVLNETVGSEGELRKLVRERDDDYQFYILAPAVAAAPDSDQPLPLSEGQDLAERLIDEVRTWMEEDFGVHVEHSEVGYPDPLEAIEAFSAEHDVDEILLVTPRAGVSKFVGADLPGRVKGVADVPIHTVHGPRVTRNEAD